MKINIGKWLRRQVFSGEPVTIGNFVSLIGGQLGYSESDTRILLLQMARDVQDGRLTRHTIEEKTDAVVREQLRREAGKWADALSELQHALR